MASLTLITIHFVLAIFIQTCYCEYSEHPYTATRFAPKHGVVYVPVCTPECYKPSHHHQSHFTSCPEKAHIGNLPLQEHKQTYHPHLDLGSQQLLQSEDHYQNQGGASHYETHGHYQNHGSASVYQQSDHHGSEQKQAIHHHGSGVSQQTFKQEYHHDLSGQQGYDHDHGYGEEDHHDGHHKKNAYYKFEYSVNDHKTGDVKRHKEERKGDVVNGEYSLLEEDGNVRTVKYYADWKSGFHAQVHNSKKSVK